MSNEQKERHAERSPGTFTAILNHISAVSASGYACRFDAVGVRPVVARPIRMQRPTTNRSDAQGVGPGCTLMAELR
jgi:hypothetical protein